MILDHGHGDSRYLIRSPYTTSFAHMGEIYLYHDLYGYIIKMSPDLLDFLNEFKDPINPADVCLKHANSFEDQTPESFVGVFLQFGCLIRPDHDQVEDIWDMIPVRGKWNVWERRADHGLTFVCAWGDSEIKEVVLSPEETRVWWSIDGEKSIKTLQEDEGLDAELVLNVFKKLGHHTVQATKLSALPMKFYKKKPQMEPPYLTSTMPYARYEPGAEGPIGQLPPPVESYFSPEGYYESEIDDADHQFDHEETTLAHLFRKPHPALDGRTFGQSLVQGLLKEERIPEGQLRVLEIGGGLGYMARDVVRALQALGREVQYDIIELSPTLAKAQRERCEGLPVTVHEGSVLDIAFPSNAYDLVLSNEMIGDLLSIKVDKKALGYGDDGEVPEDAIFAEGLEKLGQAGALIKRHAIPIGDAPDTFYLNIGAWLMVERLIDVMKPGGTAWITEYGEMGKWPVLSTHLDHPELSIHFGHLMIVAKNIGFEADYKFVIDLIDMARDQEGFVTTRSYFRALTALLASKDITLEKIGYTKEMFEALIGDTFPAGALGEIAFDRIEDRIMGLVPHEFKCLLLRKPVTIEA